MPLEADYKKLFRKMHEERRMTSISKEGTYRIDYHFAMGLAPIKKEFYRKHSNSRNYISELESKSAEI